ncbi:MAG: helix-turn-helix transcriptional regulator [Ferruginibacter sp.]
MFSFVYNNDVDYKAIVASYAQAMDTSIDEEGILNLPENYGKGYLKVAVLPNNLQVILFDYTINRDILLAREKAIGECYTLCFEEIHIVANITVNIDNDFISEDAHLRSAALLTSSVFEFGYVRRNGTKARGINILLCKDWMEMWLGIQLPDKVIKKYISLKTASFNLEPLDAEYRQLLNETLDENERRNPMSNVIIQNRIMLLIERFFTRLYSKIYLFPKRKKIDNKEIQQLMTVEFALVNDFSKLPPSMPELARISMMSQTKLKTLFKKTYGYSPYGYYQKSRMLKAKYLLNTKLFTIKEVGHKLGFQNLSNFTVAFKKEFNILPSDV